MKVRVLVLLALVLTFSGCGAIADIAPTPTLQLCSVYSGNITTMPATFVESCVPITPTP